MRSIRILGVVLSALVAVAQPARAVVPTTTSSVSYSCNGTTTSYAVPFKFLDSSHLVVTKTSAAGATSTLVLVTDYAVAGVGGTAGTVTLTAGSKCPSGYTLLVKRVVPLKQLTKLRASGVFSPPVIEDALDLVTHGLQQIDRDRSDLASTYASDKAVQSAKDASQDASLAQARSDFSAGGGTFVDATPVLATGSTTSRSLAERAADVVNVKDFLPNNQPDGTTDNTAGVALALAAGAGRTVFFPAGTYVINTVTITTAATLALDAGAVLKHKGASTDHMIKFTGTLLRITGGMINGNRTGQTGRRYAIRTEIPSGVRVDVEGVRFTGTQAAGVYATNFGGELNVIGCRFLDMAEHDGVAGHWTAATYVEAGQVGAKGLLRFNRNTLIGTNAPAQVGGAPGGLFFAPTLDYNAGIGNFSTLEAMGNWFWGIGQNCSVNDIAPIHTYPAIDGARIIGNYFEQSGFSAISAKSVQNAIIQGNVIVNGQVNAKNIATEGAISYAPGYHSGSTARPRAVISGNVIDTPGGQATAKQDGIAVLGTSTSHAMDVVIADNVITGSGNAIQAQYAEDLTITGNKIIGATGGTAGTELGVRLAQLSGIVKLAGNQITVSNGHGIYALNAVNAASFHFENNRVSHTAAATYGVTVRGAALAKFSGNVIDSTGTALSVTTDGTNPVGKFVWDLSNKVTGTVSLVFASITEASGHLAYPNDPEGLVTAPIGTLYTRTTAGQPVLYVKSTDGGNTGWAQLQVTAGASQYVYFATPYFNTANGSPVARFTYPYVAGARLVDVLVYQVTAGTGGTSWSATVRNTTGTGMLSTLPVATLASGASVGTDAKGELSLPSGWTRPVIKVDATPNVAKGDFFDVYVTEVGTYSPHAIGLVVLVFQPNA
jgi:hypothetical protein